MIYSRNMITTLRYRYDSVLTYIWCCLFNDCMSISMYVLSMSDGCMYAVLMFTVKEWSNQEYKNSS